MGGTLTLTGTNTYAGGTTVTTGALILDGAASLLAGSSLTIGNANGPGAVFATPASVQQGAVPGAGVAPVPEPGTLALLAVGVAFAIGLRSRMGRKMI